MHIATSQILVDLMNSLQRFIKIGIFYPEGHTVADQAAASFLSVLKKVAGEEGTHVRFVVSEETLSVQDIELLFSLRAVQQFHALLSSLSIASLDIHRDITVAELRQFLSRLFSLQAKVQNSRTFQEIEVTGLPSTVKVQQLKFVARKSSQSSGEEGTGDASQPTIDYLLSSLEEQGLSGDQVSMCRQLLESIPDALREKQLVEGDLPSVSWDDVEKLLRNVAESAHSQNQKDTTHLPQEKRKDIDTLASILNSFEGTTKTAKSRDAINLLVKTVKGSQSPVKSEKQKNGGQKGRSDKPCMTITDLNRLLAPFQNYSLPVDLEENNRSEELSILMQMIGQKHRSYATIRMHEALRDCLTAPMEDREWQIIIRGIQQLLKTLDRERVESALLMVLEILRRSHTSKALIFLRDICKGVSKEAVIAFWPFLVNEAFIVGPQKTPELFKEICTIASQLSREEMQRNIIRLEKLDALREQRIVPAIFSPPPSSLKVLFVLLLQHSSKAPYIVREQLVLGLRSSSFGWLDMAVAPLLDSTLPSHQQFMLDLLQQADPAEPNKILKKIGATIIIERLPDLSEEEKGAEWVINTIAGLAKVQVPGKRELLENILKTKEYLVLPAWPGAIRDAARKALNAMY